MSLNGLRVGLAGTNTNGRVCTAEVSGETAECRLRNLAGAEMESCYQLAEKRKYKLSDEVEAQLPWEID
jgi:hypothetical protein